MTIIRTPAFDVSLVVNIHHGSRFLTRTMQSFEEAARVAQAEGLRVELVLALDRPDQRSAEWIGRYDQGFFDAAQTIVLDNGSLGPSRNAGTRAARGEFVMLGDDDDLISFNSIPEFYRLAKAEGPRCIVVPQYVVNFGIRQLVARYAGSDRVSPQAFIKYHPFVSRLFAHRSIFDTLRYADLPRGGAHAYEDWHFNATALAYGYRFRSAADTVLFYRQREGSLIDAAQSESTNQIPPSPLFDPQTFIRICKDGDFIAAGAAPPEPPPEAVREEFLANPVVREIVEAAHQIEPAIDLQTLRDAPVWSNTAGDLRPGRAYLRLCEIVRHRAFTDVVLTDAGISKRDMRYLGDVFDSLNELRPGVELLLLSPHAPKDQQALWSRVPRFLALALHELQDGLGVEDSHVLALRLIENAAHGARLHFVPGVFAHGFFAKYRRLLDANKKYYYRFEHEGEPLPGGAIFHFVSTYFDAFDAVLGRDDNLLEFDRTRIDGHPYKWRLIRHHCASIETGATPIRRLLYWETGALQEQPDLLLLTAQRLSTVDPPISLDVMAENADASRRRRISLHPRLRIVSTDELFRDAERPVYDALIAEHHSSPDWPIAAGLPAAPMLQIRIAAERTPSVAGKEFGLEIVAPSAERAAALLADAIVRFYADQEWSGRLRDVVLTRVQSRYGTAAFASMVANAFT